MHCEPIWPKQNASLGGALREQEGKEGTLQGSFRRP